MRRALLVSLSVLAIVGLLHASVPEARACSCGIPSAQEAVQAADIVVVGTLKSLEEQGSQQHATIAVQRYLKGLGADELTVYGGRLDAICPPYFSSVGLGHRLLLFLQGSAEPFSAEPCAGGGELLHPYVQEALLKVEAITGPGLLPQGGGPPDSTAFPYLPAAVAATLGPLAFLAGAAFVWGRKGGAG